MSLRTIIKKSEIIPNRLYLREEIYFHVSRDSYYLAVITRGESSNIAHGRTDKEFLENIENNMRKDNNRMREAIAKLNKWQRCASSSDDIIDVEGLCKRMNILDSRLRAYCLAKDFIEMEV